MFRSNKLFKLFLLLLLIFIMTMSCVFAETNNKIHGKTLAEEEIIQNYIHSYSSANSYYGYEDQIVRNSRYAKYYDDNTSKVVIVRIPDVNLQKAVRSAIGKNSGVLLESDVKRITLLDAEDLEITNLEGIQYLSNLSELYLKNNKIKNISQVEKLINLSILSLENNEIIDINPLAALVNLEYLNLNANGIVDISALSKLNNLKSLLIQENNIEDMTPLKDVTGLMFLYARSNAISDVTPLEKLTNLKELGLSSNKLEVIDAVKNMKKLNYLGIYDNKVRDLSPISGLVNLTTIDFCQNRVDNIDALSKLISLKELYGWENLIKDVKPLSNLKNISMIALGQNFIIDLQPLKNLTNLEELYVAENQINDLTALKLMTKLDTLDIYENGITDINPLKGLKKLEILYLDDNYYPEVIDAGLFDRYDELSDKIKEIVKAVIEPDMSDYEKLMAVHEYLLTHVIYDIDNYNNNTVPIVSHTAYGALIEGVAVCDGYAKSMLALLKSSGIESYLVLGDAFGDGEYIRHAWNIVNIEGKYYNVDATYDDSDPGMIFIYFNISDDQLALDHYWDKERYPKCDTPNPYFDNYIQNSKYYQMTDKWSFIIDSDYNLYRISKENGTFTKLIDDKVSEIKVEGEWLIYVNKSENGKIYKIGLDGTDNAKLEDRDSWDITAEDGWIYYITDYTIFRMDIDGRNKTQLNYDNTTFDYDLVDSILYYSAYNRGITGLFKVKSDGSSKLQLGNDQVASLYEDGRYINWDYFKEECIYDGWIYYINLKDSYHIYKIKLDGTGKMEINDDSSSMVFVFDDWIYYRNSSDKKYYKIKIDGTERTVLE